MIQSIYSSVSNADTVSCGKKGVVIKSEPIPLLRDKFLGEYRTELEKAKVRKNLGIPDENNMEWGNIAGFVEKQTDLVEYVESKWHYTTELNEDVTNIKDAMDYALYFVTNFKGEHDAIIEIQEVIKSVNEHLDTLDKTTQTHTEDIENILESIDLANKAIEQLNKDLLSINVDANILAWVESRLKDSSTLILNESLNVKISEKENNAIIIDEGLFIKDVSASVEQNSQDIELMKEDISGLGMYTTSLSDGTSVPTQVGGIQSGTTVEQLRGKTINQIIDSLLFPTVVRDLIYPSVYYTYIDNLVEVGSTIIRPSLIFDRGDAGEEISRTDQLTFNGQLVEGTVYDMLGTYEYNGSVTYADGEYLIDNKGDVTSMRIEGGTNFASTNVTTTYPWYVGNSKQNLVKFGQQSGTLSFYVSGKATVKLPGNNSSLISFKVDGGLGYLDIDLTGWTETKETINGVPYKVWTKNDEYPSSLPHQINFKLEM